jgi:hypothetical protein
MEQRRHATRIGTVLLLVITALSWWSVTPATRIWGNQSQNHPPGYDADTTIGPTLRKSEEGQNNHKEKCIRTRVIPSAEFKNRPFDGSVRGTTHTCDDSRNRVADDRETLFSSNAGHNCSRSENRPGGTMVDKPQLTRSCQNDSEAEIRRQEEVFNRYCDAGCPKQDSYSNLTEGITMLLQTATQLLTFMRTVRVLHHLNQSRPSMQVQIRRPRITTLKSMILGLFTHMLQLEKGIKAMLRSRNYLRSLSDLIFPMFLHLSLPILCTTAASLILVVCHTCSALMILRLLGTDLAEASLIRALAHFNSVRAHCLNKQIPRPRWIKRTLKRHTQTSLTFRYARRLCQHILMIKIPACITSRWEYLTSTRLRGGGLNSKSSIDSTPRGGGAWIYRTPRCTPQ